MLWRSVAQVPGTCSACSHHVIKLQVIFEDKLCRWWKH